MRPVLVLVTSKNKKDALIDAEAISGISNLELKPIHFNDGLEHSHAESLIAKQSERFVECLEFNNSDITRYKLLNLLANLKSTFLESGSKDTSFANLAFAAAMLYPDRKAAAFLDVIACPHASDEHLSLESDDKLRTAIYGAIAQQNTKLDCSELAKNLALLLSK